ncbi:FecR family protein [Aquimarina brevivitae]|uniref:FecR family protein n=1 Tax=Aquimarina brevivitae TaxID=323412 RepID=A0A4V2F7J0_9FLAO|nr:FecR family protein [Aquimarina brevivitae]RZS99989.1 FecR family protein [Aquimarina brevivitae]
MKEKDIIIKWLNHESLSETELAKLRDMEGFSSLKTITEKAHHFKAPPYNTINEFENLKSQLTNKMKSSKNNSLSIILKIAAVVVIAIGVYFALPTSNDYEVKTLATETKDITLPDQSEVKLNALTSIRYDKENWSSQRKVYLDGEAHFKVERGNKFDIETDMGTVSVIGTRFNVKSRANYLEVVCYQGVVSVSAGDEILYLRQNEAIEYRGQDLEKKIVTYDMPSWFDNRSLFYSRPIRDVIEELEWQYGVKVNLRNIDQNILFTGNFVHSDLKSALSSIAIPLKLKCKVNGNEVTFYKE